MSFDRFLFLHKPLEYSEILTSVRVAVVLVVMWTVSVFVSTFPLMSFGHEYFDPVFFTCSVDLEGSSVAYSAVIFLIYIIPILLLVVFNLLVVKIIQKNIRAVYKLRSCAGSGIEEAKAKLRKQLHVVFVFGGFLLANLISWLPLFTIIVVNLIAGDTVLPTPVYIMEKLLFVMQVASHPTVEITLLKDLRENFKAMICYCCGK